MEGKRKSRGTEKVPSTGATGDSENQIEQFTQSPERENYEIEEVASPTSDVSRVPESPPIYTQTQDIIDDESNESKEDCKKELFPTERGPPVGVMNTFRKGSDVVIDIEYEEDEVIDIRRPEEDEILEKERQPREEFPDEDDAFLVSAAENVEQLEAMAAGTGEEVGNVDAALGEQDQIGAINTNAVDIDPDVLAEEEKRRNNVNHFRKFEAMDKIFPDVRCSEYNTVGFFLKKNYAPMDPLEPNPPKCVAKWDPKFVPMPFCEENIATVRCRNNQASSDGQPNADQDNADEYLQDQPVIRRIPIWRRINETLSKFSLESADEIGNALRRYCPRMNRELSALKYCTEKIMTKEERENFFLKVIPFMASLVVQTPEIVTCPIPFLRKNVNHNISLSQKQIACLLANAFFCTFPRRFKSELDMPSINFKDLFMEDDEKIMKTKAQKIRCLIHYFTRIEAEMPQGVVTYTRKNLRHSSMPDWGKIDKNLTKIVPLIQGTIEDDGAGMLKVDFANCFLGGGALGRGAVQEEILFVIYPELILSRLFSEKLNFNEAVIITGCERFSNYKGYASGFTFDGDYQDTTPYDCKGRRCNQIVAIDALYISRPSFQYHPKHITRELNKAYVGFQSPIPQPVAIATGKWGCGAFNGNPQLKAIIQLLAASHAGRDIAFFTFGDIETLNDVLSIYSSIHTLKIKDVWNLLHQYHTICCASGKPSRSLKDFCSQYSAGQLWQIDQEKKSAAPSSSGNLKEVPITHFYSRDNKPLQPDPATLDDDSVNALINGIDKINSSKKTVQNTTEKNIPSGKRQREDELTEEQITDQLQQEDSSQSQIPVPAAIKLQNGLKGGSAKYDNSNNSSPTSSKRSRLVDFYQSSKD